MPSKLRVPRPKTGERATYAYERMRHLIVHGAFEPGARLVETDLADRLGVSRTPVRSAVQRLAQEGFLVTRDEGVQARPRVAPLTKADAREVFEVLGVLEGLAASRAAALSWRERAAVVERLEEANVLLADASNESGDGGEAFFNRDHVFHTVYMEAGAGPRLRSIHAANIPHSERYIRVYVKHLHNTIATSVREHDMIIDAVRAGDVEGARNAVIRNFANACERLADIIEDVSEEPND